MKLNVNLEEVRYACCSLCEVAPQCCPAAVLLHPVLDDCWLTLRCVELRVPVRVEDGVHVCLLASRHCWPTLRTSFHLIPTTAFLSFFTPLQKIGKEWRAKALAACDLPMKAYWVCRQEAGLGVFYECRAQNEAMNACISGITGDKTAFEAYRQGRIETLAPAYYAHKERLLQAKLKHYSEKLGEGGGGVSHVET